MRMISEMAGHPLSRLSHYSRNKDGLYVEVFQYFMESSSPRQVIRNWQGLDAQGAVWLSREQIPFIYQRTNPDAQASQLLQDHQARLWMREFHAPRPTLHPLLKKYLAPSTDLIRECIRVLRLEVNETQLTFLGATIMNQLVGHGTMSGLLKVLLGEHQPFGSHFQEAELLVEFCLRGLLAGATD